MAEIRANREYKFKEFSISEEIPKCPPIKAKRWTFHDSIPDSTFYDRPAQRKWDENVNCSGDTSINQQFVKSYEKPESHLRAEFFNAYKKYYRRVDIKRLELQSTLNVDAKLKGADESIAGESSLYKEKECTEINIVMDTEKDDALVSCKVRRAVLSVSPAENERLGKESIIHKTMTLGCPKQQTATINDRDIIFGEIIMNESSDCLPSIKSNSLSANLSVRQEQIHEGKEDLPNMTSRLKQEQSLMNRTLVSSVRESEDCKKTEPKSMKNLPQMSDHVSLINDEPLFAGPCNNMIKQTNFLEDDTPFQRKGGETSKPTDVDVKNPKAEQNKYTKKVERTFRNSKLKQNNKNPVNSMPFKFRNVEEKFNRYEVFQNRKSNVKHDGFINLNGSARVSEPEQDGYNFDPVHFDNSRSNPSNDSYEISQKTAKSFNLRCNRNLDQFGPKSNPDEILAARAPVMKHHTNKSDSTDIEEATFGSGSVKTQVKNHNIAPNLRTESAQEPWRNNSYPDNENSKILTSLHINPELGVRFRGIRGGPFNEPNKSVLKSLVVCAAQGDSLNGRNVVKRVFNEECNLTQGNNNKEILETGDVAFTCSFGSDNCASSQLKYRDPPESSIYGKVEVPERFQNITKTISNDLCCVESPFTSMRSENTEKPFVIWTNKNCTGINESLKINKLTMSDESNTGFDDNNHSNSQSFPGSYDLRKTSDDNNNQDNKLHRSYSQSSEKLLGKTHLKEDFKTSNGTERKENESRQGQFPKKLYSNMNSLQGKNVAVPNYSFYHKNSRVTDGDCSKKGKDYDGAKESPKKKIHEEEVAVFLDENGFFSGERRGGVSQMYFIEDSFGKRGLHDKSRQNSCVAREKQAIERVPRRYEKDATMNETRRMSNIQDEDAGKINASGKIPNEQSNINIFQSNISNKNISKSSNSDYLQIGPTYSVHYRPVHKKQIGTDLHKNYVERCEADDMYNGGLVKKNLQCDTTDMTCYERSAGVACSNLPPLYCDNYLNKCRQETIRNPHLQPNSGFNGCGCPNAGNTCDCDDFNRESCCRVLKNINVSPCYATDSNLHCYSPIDSNCQVNNGHHSHLSCPCLEENRSCCHLCNDQQLRVLFKECSSQFHKANISHCYCTRPLNEKLINAANARIDNFYGEWSGNEQMKYRPIRFDHDKQWISTGHQPTRSSNKCTSNANKERFRESSGRCIVASDEVSEPFMKEYGTMKDCGNHSPANPKNNDNRICTQECLVMDNDDDDDIMNNPYYCNKEIKNGFQPASNGRDSVKNYPLKEIKTERKYNSNPVYIEGTDFNFLDRVDNSGNQSESKVTGIKLKPEQNGYVVPKTKQFSNDDNEVRIMPPLESYETETKSIVRTHKTTDRPGNEPLILCEEQWDSDGGLPIRRVIRKRKEKKEEKVDSTVSGEVPIYLREEHWESDDEKIEEDSVSPRHIPSTSAHYPKTTSFPWNRQRFASSYMTRNVSEGEEYKKCSSAHTVSDPSFQCEGQWASGEEKCEDHKAQSTLPKNITRRRKGKRRWYNPKRWDMVTDLPKNGFQNGSEGDDFQDDNIEGSVPFQNRKYYSNKEQ